MGHWAMWTLPTGLCTHADTPCHCCTRCFCPAVQHPLPPLLYHVGLQVRFPSPTAACALMGNPLLLHWDPPQLGPDLPPPTTLHMPWTRPQLPAPRDTSCCSGRSNGQARAWRSHLNASWAACSPWATSWTALLYSKMGALGLSWDGIGWENTCAVSRIRQGGVGEAPVWSHLYLAKPKEGP